MVVHGNRVSGGNGKDRGRGAGDAAGDALAADGVQASISLLLVIARLAGLVPQSAALPVFFLWSVSVFFMVGLTFGNLNSLALQPLGHIADTAASVIGAISTVLGVVIAVPIGLAVDGSPMPLYVGTGILSGLAYLLMRRTVEV